MLTCKKCGRYFDTDADFLTTEKDVCITCGPHVLVEYGLDIYGDRHVQVNIMNLPDYEGEDDALFYYGTYKKNAIDHAKKIAKKYQRNLPILYKGIKPKLSGN